MVVGGVIDVVRGCRALVLLSAVSVNVLRVVAVHRCVSFAGCCLLIVFVVGCFVLFVVRCVLSVAVLYLLFAVVWLLVVGCFC